MRALNKFIVHHFFSIAIFCNVWKAKTFQWLQCPKSLHANLALVVLKSIFNNFFHFSNKISPLKRQKIMHPSGLHFNGCFSIFLFSRRRRHFTLIVICTNLPIWWARYRKAGSSRISNHSTSWTAQKWQKLLFQALISGAQSLCSLWLLVSRSSFFFASFWCSTLHWIIIETIEEQGQKMNKKAQFNHSKLLIPFHSSSSRQDISLPSNSISSSSVLSFGLKNVWKNVLMVSCLKNIFYEPFIIRLRSYLDQQICRFQSFSFFRSLWVFFLFFVEMFQTRLRKFLITILTYSFFSFGLSRSIQCCPIPTLLCSSKAIRNVREVKIAIKMKSFRKKSSSSRSLLYQQHQHTRRHRHL